MEGGLERFLLDIPAPDAARVGDAFTRCPRIEVDAGEPYFHGCFGDASLLLVDDGFVVLRAAATGRSRSVITCEGGPGRWVLPPSADEVLYGLGASRLIAVPAETLDRLLAIPPAAQALHEHLATTLGQRQETIGNFASTRHVDRVRRKLLQLGRSYGRVARDGVRLDFPVSHTVLAEMIGSSRETVTRALDELQRTGFVERSGHTYRLLVSPESMLDAA